MIQSKWHFPLSYTSCLYTVVQKGASYTTCLLKWYTAVSCANKSLHVYCLEILFLYNKRISTTKDKTFVLFILPYITSFYSTNIFLYPSATLWSPIIINVNHFRDYLAVHNAFLYIYNVETIVPYKFFLFLMFPVITSLHFLHLYTFCKFLNKKLETYGDLYPGDLLTLVWISNNYHY